MGFVQILIQGDPPVNSYRSVGRHAREDVAQLAKCSAADRCQSRRRGEPARLLLACLVNPRP